MKILFIKALVVLFVAFAASATLNASEHGIPVLVGSNGQSGGYYDPSTNEVFASAHSLFKANGDRVDFSVIRGPFGEVRIKNAKAIFKPGCEKYKKGLKKAHFSIKAASCDLVVISGHESVQSKLSTTFNKDLPFFVADPPTKISVRGFKHFVFYSKENEPRFVKMSFNRIHDKTGALIFNCISDYPCEPSNGDSGNLIGQYDENGIFRVVATQSGLSTKQRLIIFAPT